MDGNGGTPVRDAIVLMVNGRFSAIGRRGEIDVPGSATVVDASGQFVLPGSMNGNVHLLDAIMLMGKGGAEYLARFEGRLHPVAIAPMAQLAHVFKDGTPVDFKRLPTTPLVTKYPRAADSSTGVSPQPLGGRAGGPALPGKDHGVFPTDVRRTAAAKRHRLSLTSLNP